MVRREGKERGRRKVERCGGNRARGRGKGKGGSRQRTEYLEQCFSIKGRGKDETTVEKRKERED